MEPLRARHSSRRVRASPDREEEWEMEALGRAGGGKRG